MKNETKILATATELENGKIRVAVELKGGARDVSFLLIPIVDKLSERLNISPEDLCATVVMCLDEERKNRQNYEEFEVGGEE